MISLRLALSTGLLICVFTAQSVFAQEESKLIRALRVDYSALVDARVEFEQAEKNANTSYAEMADYAEWILQLNRQFSESCRKLAVSQLPVVPEDIPCSEYTSAYQAPVAIDINTEITDAERTTAMLNDFNASLGDFDEKLLREQDRVKARKAQTASAGGGASGSGESENGAEEPEGPEGSEGDSENSGQSGQRSDQGNESGDSTQANSTAGSPSASGRPSSAPAGTPDGRSDDVIARQLREAAEKETDPELKRKLWEEYRRYKQG